MCNRCWPPPGPVPTGPGWAYEFKWDGIRAIVEARGGEVRAHSRNGRDITSHYPELPATAELLRGRDTVLDGEVIAIGQSGVPDFAVLQQRMHVRSPAARLLMAVPVQYYVFDVLALDGAATIALPYHQRRELLGELGLAGPVLHAPPHFTGHGQDVLTAAREAGLEGVMAKRLDSAYQPGQRSRAWVKTPITPTAEVIVVGWKAGGGRRAGTIGSLLLGGRDAIGQLIYIGHVGTGFTHAALAALLARLGPLARAESPLDVPAPREFTRDARWVRPVLVGEVAYRNVRRGRLPQCDAGRPVAPSVLAWPAPRSRAGRDRRDRDGDRHAAGLTRDAARCGRSSDAPLFVRRAPLSPHMQ
jgi:bifunctional non-homologous end joining protein LigD